MPPPGEQNHPTSSITSPCLRSFANSPAAAATLAQEEEEEMA